MASPEANAPTTPAPEAQASALPAAQDAPPGLTPGADFVALQAQYDALLKWKALAEADLQKGRAAKKDAEDRATAEQAATLAKAREAGDFAKLHDAEKDQRIALEARLADALPKAERLTAHEKRVSEKLKAAKDKGDLPSFITRSIDIAATRDVDEALDILDEYRASIGVPAAPAKLPAPHAPSPGAAPSSPPAPKSLGEMSPGEIKNLSADELNKLLGRTQGSGARPGVFGRFFVQS